MAGLTLDPTVAADADGYDSYVSQLLGQGIRYRRFSAAAAAGDATTVIAAGASGTKHMVHAIYVDVDTAGESLAILSAAATIWTIRFPVVDSYMLVFRYPIECNAAELLALDKGTVAAIGGIVWYSTATSGQPMAPP